MKIQIEATSHAGVTETFDAELTVAPGDWRYAIWTADRSDFFEARFLEHGPDHVRSDLLCAHSKELRGRGLPEALIRHVRAVSGCTVVSSRRGSEPYESRTIEGERVWRRFVEAGIATYDADEDRYTFTG